MSTSPMFSTARLEVAMVVPDDLGVALEMSPEQGTDAGRELVARVIADVHVTGVGAGAGGVNQASRSRSEPGTASPRAWLP